jgi:hypothetical protein
LSRRVRATPLGTIGLALGLHGRHSFRLGPGRTAPPLVLTPPRDLQELPQATALALGGLLVNPRVLYGRCGAKSAAAFLRNSFHRGDLLESVPQLLRASVQPLEDALPILCFIVRGPWVLVRHAVP